MSLGAHLVPNKINTDIPFRTQAHVPADAVVEHESMKDCVQFKTF